VGLTSPTLNNSLDGAGAHSRDGPGYLPGNLSRLLFAAEERQALGVIAPRQRAALVLRYFEDLSEIQVAETIGCSLGTWKR
jgi:DNA-directed RNA polymerase specialized sigma24 family protein